MKFRVPTGISALRWIGVAALGALAGCSAVGPKYVPPKPPKATAYAVRQPTDVGGAGPSLHFRDGTRPDRMWWRALHSAGLDEVVRRALAGNFDLAAAQAKLEQARELSIASQGEPHPQLDLSAAVSDRKFNGAQFEDERGSFNIYSAGAQVSYSPDIFGALRRVSEGAAAQADYARYKLGAAYLSVIGNTLKEALTVAELTAQQSALREQIDIDRKRLKLARALVAVSAMSERDLHAFVVQLLQDQSALSGLEQKSGNAQNALAVLTGSDPGAWTSPKVVLADLRIPHELPLSVPSQLVHQRPDIEAAEALLRAANANIGVAVANLYPRVVISASTIFSLGADMSLPLLHWDSLMAQKRATDAAYQAAMANYRKTVVESFSQVATVLRALQYDRRAVAEADALQQSSADQLRLLRAQSQVGRLARMPLLDAMREDQGFKAERVRATAQLFRDVVQLYLALGGGWEPESGRSSPVRR